MCWWQNEKLQELVYRSHVLKIVMTEDFFSVHGMQDEGQSGMAPHMGTVKECMVIG